MNHPNIIWLTIDSIRADHTSVHGYDVDTTPFLDSLSDSSDTVCFDNCFSHGMSTRTSTASILSGVYPSRHQTWTNTSLTEVEALPDELVTAPELLRELGYETVGVSPNVHFSPGTELDRGFDDFTYLTPKRVLQDFSTSTLIKFLLGIRSHSAGFTLDQQKHSRSYLIKEKIVDEIQSKKSPLFLYGHFNEPHTAWHPPLPYIEEYLDRTSLDKHEAIEFAMKVHREDIPQGSQVNYSKEEWNALTALYDAEIKYTDDLVETIYNAAQEEFGEDFIFVVTGDHGDLFGEYNFVGHMHCLHDGLIHVPMVVKGLLESTESNGSLVQHIDIMKTILESVGADTDQWEGHDLRQSSRDVAISQRSPENNPVVFSGEMLTTARTDEYKLVHSEEGSDLYKLPDESADRSEEHKQIYEYLREFTEKFLQNEGAPITARKEGNLTQDMKEQLRDLGYV